MPTLTWIEQNPDQSIADALRASASAPQPTRSDSRDQLLAKAAFAGVAQAMQVKSSGFASQLGGKYILNGNATPEAFGPIVLPNPVEGGVVEFYNWSTDYNRLLVLPDGRDSGLGVAGYAYTIFLYSSGAWDSRSTSFD